MKRRIASIDIGTNSVLLTIAEPFQTSKVSKTVFEAATITRIGEGLAASKRFKPEAIERTISALKNYAEICRKKSVEKIFTVGTEAMRRAKNSDEFIRLVKERCGLDIEIISGKREAELSFNAVEKDFGSSVIVVDIGGGSTEFIFPDAKSKLNVISLPLGCVILHERYCRSDPISEMDFTSMQNDVVAGLCAGHHGRPRRAAPTSTTLVATAGTATTLAAMKLRLKEYKHNEVHGFKLCRDDLKKIIEEMKGLTIEERKRLPGLEPARADVILPGALILLEVMKKFGFDRVTVSDRGVRWGLIYEKFGI